MGLLLGLPGCWPRTDWVLLLSSIRHRNCGRYSCSVPCTINNGQEKASQAGCQYRPRFHYCTYPTLSSSDGKQPVEHNIWWSVEWTGILSTPTSAQEQLLCPATWSSSGRRRPLLPRSALYAASLLSTSRGQSLMSPPSPSPLELLPPPFVTAILPRLCQMLSALTLIPRLVQKPCSPLVYFCCLHYHSPFPCCHRCPSIRMIDIECPLSFTGSRTTW